MARPISPSPTNLDRAGDSPPNSTSSPNDNLGGIDDDEYTRE
jgi:hypothetical protein